MPLRVPPARVALAVLAAAAAGALGSGCQQTSAVERTCSGSLAISVDDVRGSSLPMKVLALTFDDGPGPRTTELADYLKSKGIRAAFFVNGMNVANSLVLQEIVADGHVLGNHTQDHRSLTGRSTGTAHMSAADVVGELVQTDVLIAPFVPDDRFMFRAPFGDFDTQAADAIDASPMKKYVGPISWDIGDHMGPDQAVDWDCWQPGSDGKVLTVQQCGDLYVKEIESVGHGIVLMHDLYFIDNDPQKGGTVDMVKYIVPILEAKGYSFARVDEVPDIAAQLPPLTSADAGAGGSTGEGVSNTGKSDGTSSGSDPSGGNTEPCPPSPHEAVVHTGESGNLRLH